MKILVFVSAMILTGCATIKDRLEIKKMKTQDRIYAGRILVDFNGRKNVDLKCEFYVGRGIVPDIKLSPEGYIFFKSDNPSFRISRIACYEQPDFYTAAWHHQSIPLGSFVKGGSPYEATYFGDIHITWKTNPEDTRTAAATDQTSPTFPKIGRVEKSGVIQVEVQDGFAAIQPLFQERVKNESWNPDGKEIILENRPVKIENNQ